MTAQEKDRIECAIRHIQTAVDVDPWAAEIAVEAMRKLLVKDNHDFSQGLVKDTISRQAAIEALGEEPPVWYDGEDEIAERNQWRRDVTAIKELSSAQPEPLLDAYMKSVWTWLLEYQIKAAELKGRYTPYEVLSWVVNDWRKEHEGSD